MLQLLATKVLAMSAPFDAGRSPQASVRCKAHVRRYLLALADFDMWAIGSEYNAKHNQITNNRTSRVTRLCSCLPPARARGLLRIDYYYYFCVPMLGRK